MSNKIIFYNKNDSDFELISLVQHSLTHIKMVYDKRINMGESDLNYDKTHEEDFNLIGVLLSTSFIWIENIMSNFQKLSLCNIYCLEINKSDYNVLKYIVDFCWYNSFYDELLFSKETYEKFNLITKKELFVDDEFPYLKIIK